MTKETDEKILLTTRELSKCLGIGRDKTYALMKMEGFPSIRMGNSYYVYIDSVKEWIKANEGRELDI